MQKNEEWKHEVKTKITQWADATQGLSDDCIQSIMGTIRDETGSVQTTGPSLLELRNDLSSIPEQIRGALEPGFLDINARLSEMPGHIKGDSGPNMLELKEVMKGNLQTLDGHSNARFATAKQEHEVALLGLTTHIKAFASAAMTSQPMSSSIISTSAAVGDNTTQQLGSFN